MWRNFILGLLGLALIGIAAPAGANDTLPWGRQMAQCNRTMAVALGSAQQVVHGVGDPIAHCNAIAGAFIGYSLAGCLQMLDDGLLRGLIVASNAPVQDDGISSPLGITICTALSDCGILAQIPPEFEVCIDFQ